MSSNSISDFSSNIQADIGLIEDWEREEIKRLKEALRELTDEQSEAFGLGDKKVMLSSDGMHELWRDRAAAYIHDLMFDKWITLRWDDQNGQDDDYHPRFKVKIADIKQVSRLYESLGDTGLWKSINPNKTTGVYLSRLSLALKGVNLHWDANADKRVRLEVDHKDQCCVNDHADNLQVLTKSEHLKKEFAKDREVESQLKATMVETAEKAATLEDVRTAAEDTADKLIALLNAANAAGGLSKEESMVLSVLEAWRG